MFISGNSGVEHRSSKVPLYRLSMVSTIALVLSGCGSSRSESHDYAKSTAPLLEALTDDAFKAAAGCGDCTVIAKAELSLPETKVSAVSAKLMGKGAKNDYVTLTADGTRVDEGRLLEAENITRFMKYGKLSKALYEALPLLPPDERVWVGIWERIPAIEMPPREALAASSALVASHRKQVADALSAASTTILPFLKSQNARVVHDGTSSPLIQAEVPASAIPALEKLDAVGSIGLSGLPTPDGDYSWYFTDRLDNAHLWSQGNGVNVCHIESAQPDSYACLSTPAGIRVPGGSADGHSRLTTGILRATDVPGGSAAPQSPIYIANTGAGAPPGNEQNWCVNQTARVHSCSYSHKRPQGESDWTDWLYDWSGYYWPFPVVVMSAGDPGEVPGLYIGRRFYNGLVVGGSTDQGGLTGNCDYTTNTIDDDVVWQDGRYINYQTAHQCGGVYDYELPHIMAPACCVSAGCNMRAGCGNSASTPQVAGTAALVIARDPATFNYWPEMTRAVLLATATNGLDEGTLSHMYCGQPDRHGGAGALNAEAAVGLADPYWWDRTATNGRYVSFVYFPTDFDGAGYWKKTFHTGQINATRFRTVIVWDATPANCNSYGFCESSTLDADLDLQVWDDSTGILTQSTTYTSGWEIVDIPVVGGHSYTMKVKKYTNPSPNTYLAIAWWSY